MADEPSTKRRRVTKACESCRALKSKCDGQQPVCGRCRGYGYICLWAEGNGRARRDGDRLANESPSPLPSETAAVRRALQAYDGLLSSLAPNLSGADRAVLDLTISSIRQSLPPHLACTDRAAGRSHGNLTLTRSQESEDHSINSSRYLGEASDVCFFNSVRNLLQDVAHDGNESARVDSYEREGRAPSGRGDPFPPELPRKEIADGFVDVYFSTIHIAYPFFCRGPFLQEYAKIWSAPSIMEIKPVWLASLLTVFAIGSYYASFTSPERCESDIHERLFLQAISLTKDMETERSLDNVRLLLAQCFYLLATCQTDKCWTTLGLVVRIGQSIGLHVEDDPMRMTQTFGAVEREMRRRTWYCTYVLDRLLSLQLGRPSAIRNRDYTVQLPSRLDDARFDVEADCIPAPGDGPQAGDYFLSVIQFSHVVGHVMRDLYRPSMLRSADLLLATIDRLDGDILQWRSQLPRTLRFDLGHAFEKSITLKRQRNMLAIKFHHLRALIHRSHLCLPWLRAGDSALACLSEEDRHRVSLSERICVSEAQETARLLHNVTDEQSLVHDFPWWQMISCLICASSILLVASMFVDPPHPAEVPVDVLKEDAETCLKIFDALSVNSDAARLARDMMNSLKTTRIQGESWKTHPGHISSLIPVGNANRASTRLHDDVPTQAVMGLVSQGHPVVSAGTVNIEDPISNDAQMWDWQQWPCEISDSMMWSSQFIPWADNSDMNGLSGQ